MQAKSLSQEPMKSRETAGNRRQMYKHKPPFPPLFSKCILVALIWCEMSARHNGKKIPSDREITRHLLEVLSPMIILVCISLEEKVCRRWQSDEVVCRAVLLSVLFF
ncbi:hypothetical protein HQ42_07175 [Porphyromonas gulae]|nr:hypothetical protein HQ42_07175 [Porphyromonas gulae]